jgi:hypothetical protein
MGSEVKVRLIMLAMMRALAFALSKMWTHWGAPSRDTTSLINTIKELPWLVS